MAKPCSRWPASTASGPAPPEAAVARRCRRPAPATRCSTELGHRLAVGLAAIVSVLDPELIVLAGGVSLPAVSACATLVRDELADLAVPRPRSS